MREPRAYHPAMCRGCMRLIFSGLYVHSWVSETQRRFIMRARFEHLRQAAIAAVAAFALVSCGSLTVKSADGTMIASYQGSALLGSEAISCGQASGVYTCQLTAQNLSALAQALAPLLAAGAAGSAASVK